MAGSRRDRLHIVCTKSVQIKGGDFDETPRSHHSGGPQAGAADGRLSKGTAAIEDWNDDDLTYLTLRQRGRTVTWLVRAYNVTRKIGVATGQFKDPEYLGVREAKERARETYAKIAAGKGTRPLPGTEWTWSDLAREYQASLRE